MQFDGDVDYVGCRVSKCPVMLDTHSPILTSRLTLTLHAFVHNPLLTCSALLFTFAEFLVSSFYAFVIRHCFTLFVRSFVRSLVRRVRYC